MDDPTTSDLALAAEASYTDQAPEDYTKQADLSSPEISTYKHNTKSHYIISHRGTDLADPKTARKDVRADLNIALGNKEADAMHKRRTKKTEAIVKSIKKKDPEHDIFLTGHSLGGSTSSHAIASSKVVRDNVKEHHTFNSGSSALQKKPDVTPEVRAQLMEKSTHHSVKGDEISAHVGSNLIGKQKKYASTKKPSIAQHVLALATPLLKRTFAGKIVAFGAKKALGTLQAHSLDNFIKRKK
jgi:hypothetical protein